MADDLLRVQDVQAMAERARQHWTLREYDMPLLTEAIPALCTSHEALRAERDRLRRELAEMDDVAGHVAAERDQALTALTMLVHSGALTDDDYVDGRWGALAVREFRDRYGFLGGLEEMRRRVYAALGWEMPTDGR